jgi:RecA-family ATPase
VGVGDLAVIFGPSESGKSVLAVDMACRLAAGIDLNGDPSLRSNVLYIAAERAAQVKRRVTAFCRHYDGEPFDNLVIYSGTIDLTQPDELSTIVRAAAWKLGDEIHVVVVDTLAAAMSASDSSPEAMARAVNNLTGTVRSGNLDGIGCTVIVVHHSPVSGEQRLRGGGQLQGAADITIAVARRGETSTATVVKNNESPSRPTRSYRMETVSLGMSEDGVETTAPVLVSVDSPPPKAPQSVTPKPLREALATLRDAIAANDNNPVTEEQWREAVYASAGDISASGKRVRFSRQRRELAGLIGESAGKYSIL